MGQMGKAMAEKNKRIPMPTGGYRFAERAFHCASCSVTEMNGTAR